MGNVFVADFGNNTIREISPAGVVTTVAGKAGEAGSTDGTASNARFNGPTSVAVDTAGNVYVSDAGNGTIRKLSPVEPLPVTVHALPATEGEPFSGLVATFTDPDPAAVSTDFTATIDWGDGTASNGTVIQQGGAGSPFQVNGSHTYDEEGGYPITVQIHDSVTDLDSVGNVNISRLVGDQSEGTIAVDPVNPNLVFAASNLNSAVVGLFAAYSTDGGATWITRTLGDAVSDHLPLAFSDPSATFDKYGNLFLTYIDSTGNNVEILLSTNGGQTFQLLTSVTDFSNTGGVDQTKVAAGPGPGGVNGSVWVSFQDPVQRIASVAASVTGLGMVGTFGAPQEVVGSGGAAPERQLRFHQHRAGRPGRRLVAEQFRGGGPSHDLRQSG